MIMCALEPPLVLFVPTARDVVDAATLEPDGAAPCEVVSAMEEVSVSVADAAEESGYASHSRQRTDRLALLLIPAQECHRGRPADENTLRVHWRHH